MTMTTGKTYPYYYTYVQPFSLRILNLKTLSFLSLREQYKFDKIQDLCSNLSVKVKWASFF